MKGVWGTRRKQRVDDLRNRNRYWDLKGEAKDRKSRKSFPINSLKNFKGW